MKALNINITILLIIISALTFGQRRDSTMAVGGITGDTIYIIHENIPKSRIWGNSWYIATSYNLCRINEFDFNFGRTYGSQMCGGAGCTNTMRSWGAGFGLTSKNGKTKQIANAFWESCFFYFPPFSAGIRADYIYNITDNSHYFRPSVGFSFFYFDIFYNYSFNLNGTDNDFKHGVTFRLKYFHKQKNWQKNYPNRC